MYPISNLHNKYFKGHVGSQDYSVVFVMEHTQPAQNSSVYFMWVYVNCSKQKPLKVGPSQVAMSKVRVNYEWPQPCTLGEPCMDPVLSYPCNIVKPHEFTSSDIVIPSGHIIGTSNLFWESFIDPNTKTLKKPTEIREGGDWVS